MDTMMNQCKLRRGETVLTAWIESRGAKVGAEVELLPDRELWRVVGVYQPAMAQSKLKAHQLMHRASLPSVEPIR